MFSCYSKSDTTQWIQVDFLTPKQVTGVVTQGSPDLSQWVTSFSVSTSKDGSTFTTYMENGIKKIFRGNSDGNTVVKNYFAKEISARIVRLHPVTWENGIAMRFDILNCYNVSYVTMETTTPITKVTWPYSTSLKRAFCE